MIGKRGVCRCDGDDTSEKFVEKTKSKSVQFVIKLSRGLPVQRKLVRHSQNSKQNT